MVVQMHADNIRYLEEKKDINSQLTNALEESYKLMADIETLKNKKQPIYKRWWVWGLIGLTAGIFIAK